MHFIRENLAVCGFQGIGNRQEFESHGFDAQLQCVASFDEWLQECMEVKELPFDDGKPIPRIVLEEAIKWLGEHWEMGSKILISCAGGQSRSVTMAISILYTKSQLSFIESVHDVLAHIPEAYPHPKVLISAARYCGVTIQFEDLRSIYDNVKIPPPFPWSDEELREAIHQTCEMKYGFIGDIHGNLENLKKAVSFLENEGCTIFCLGDIVSDDSMDNDACVCFLMEKKVRSVYGQHDDTCRATGSPTVGESTRGFLWSLPETIRENNIFMVHDNPLEKARQGKGMWQNGSYIRTGHDAQIVLDEFDFRRYPVDFIVVGHTHVSGIFSRGKKIEFKFGEAVPLSSPPYIINVGHIGGASRQSQDCLSLGLMDMLSSRLTIFDLDNLPAQAIPEAEGNDASFSEETQRCHPLKEH